MPYTLQRKMFKLGGSVAHGGGITANLKHPNRVHMNKGGSVAPIGLVGKGPLHMKGPDGKMREMQNPLALLGLLARAGGTGGLRSIPALLRGLGSRSTKPISDFVMKSATGASRPTAKQLAKMTPAEIKRTVGTYGFGPTGRMSQIGRGLETGIGALAPVGAVSSLLPELEKGKDKPISTLVQNLREIPETALNAAIGLPTGVVGLLSGQGGAGFTPSDALQNTLYPDGPKDIKTVAKDEEITQAKVKEAAEDDLRAEYERLLGGRPNPVGEIGTAIATALPSLAEDDLAGAAAAYTQQLKTGVDKMDEYDRGVGQFILQDKITEGQTNQAMIAEALASGDLDTVSKIKKYQAAAEELGDVTPLPVKGKNKPDYDSMRAGTVYADVTTSTGSKYLAINRSGDDELRTNSADAAVNFANA